VSGGMGGGPGGWAGGWVSGWAGGWARTRSGGQVSRQVGATQWADGRVSKGDGKGGQYLSLWQQGAAHSLGLAKPAQLRVCTLLGTDTTTGPGRLLYTGGYKCMFAA
jgi:hypothetical protein